jgi:putative DNA primase/helicase
MPEDLRFLDADAPPQGRQVRRAKARADERVSVTTPPRGIDRDAMVLDPLDPVPSARAFAAQEYTVADILALRHQGGQFFAFDQYAYRESDEAEIRATLYRFLETAARVSNGQLQPFQPTKAKVENALDALRAVSNLPVSSAAPCWLDMGTDQNRPDPLEVVVCRNGLLHVPTRELVPATPAFFSINGLDFPYNPAAPAPSHWLTFLEDLWPGDIEASDSLQEWVGYLLTPDTRFQKIGMLIGPRRSGKGTIGRVIRRLLGDRNTCGPTLANMSEQFGLATLIGKTAAIIADARISGRTDTAVVTERLLSISGEDTLSIPRKFLPDWTGKLPTRFMLLTNELPRIEDASGALSSRFIVWTLKRSFLDEEDIALFERFLPELPGILNWALEGRDRLYARGRFVQPTSAANLIQQFEELGSPIGAFLRDRCDIGQGYECTAQTLFAEWRSWCTESNRDRPGTIQTFGRNLRAALPWLGESFPRVCGRRVRFYEGIRLHEGED